MSTTPQYPCRINVVYIGRRFCADKSIGYAYLIITEDKQTISDDVLLFDAKAKYAIIGGVFGIIQTGEKSFRLADAQFLYNYNNSNKVAEWKALDGATETEKDLMKEEKESDEWADTLRPIREAYFKARTRRQQSAIIARVIVAIQHGKL